MDSIPRTRKDIQAPIREIRSTSKRELPFTASEKERRWRRRRRRVASLGDIGFHDRDIYDGSDDNIDGRVSSILCPATQPNNNGGGTPTRKTFNGPDVCSNPKDLGLNKQLGSWIEFIQRKPLMSAIPVTKDKLLERRQDLRGLEIENQDKFCRALESIPLPVLEQFPNFNPVSFKKLQRLRLHVKAKLRLLQTQLSKLQKEDEKTLYEFPETPGGSASSDSIESPNSRMSECRSTNDRDNFDASRTSVSKCTRALFRRRDSAASVTMESHINAKEHDNGVEPMAAAVEPPENTASNKKSIFRLKRPIRTVLGSQVSKRIAEMWKKDRRRSTKTIDSSVASDCDFVEDITFNDGSKTPSSNEKNMQGNVVLGTPDSNPGNKSVTNDI
ncbi:uncharacterized protein [Temnothorax nylanderi]|uniref:uncharacterized protein isoform X3 n=1 Tax=Temnothorax nylanderi TaxID=102681 RepID=UPI003A84D245